MKNTLISLKEMLLQRFGFWVAINYKFLLKVERKLNLIHPSFFLFQLTIEQAGEISLLRVVFSRTIYENSFGEKICPGIFSTEHACLFGGLLACSFQRLWYAALMGRWCGRVVDTQS